MKKIGLACDHGGYQMKEFVAGYLESLGVEFVDYGCYSADSVDYPDLGHKLADAISNGEVERGIAFCGSANGISMSINRHKGIRAAVCWIPEIAKLARQHNDANVCSIPGRFVDTLTAAAIVDAYINSTFEGGRHQARIAKIEL